MTGAPVVVGVDGSELSLIATRLAAREAASLHRPLRVVHAFNWGPFTGELPDDQLRVPAERLTALAANAATQTAPQLEVEQVLVEGSTVTTLLRESGLATLVVLGDGGLNSCTCVAPEVTAMQVAARAGCSVLVVREDRAPPGTVLVGVDGSSTSPAVLEAAFDLAARHEAELTVVRTRDPDGTHPAGEPEQTAQDRDRVVSEQLGRLVGPWRQRYPGIHATERLIIGDLAEVLVELSRDVELVVVGAGGEQPQRGGLGAVSQTLLHHAPVPVVVVHQPHQLYVQE